jgi:hypothetical protein
MRLGRFMTHGPGTRKGADVTDTSRGPGLDMRREIVRSKDALPVRSDGSVTVSRVNPSR